MALNFLNAYVFFSFSSDDSWWNWPILLKLIFKGIKQRKMGRSLSIHILSRIAIAILHLMLTLHRFYQKWIQLLDISLVSKELENWLLVSENTPGHTVQGVSQLFMEVLDILTAKPDYLFWMMLPYSPNIIRLCGWRNRKIHGKTINFEKKMFFTHNLCGQLKLEHVWCYGR